MKRTTIIILFVSFFVFLNAIEASARQAWAVVDADTGRLLSGSNENVRLPIASLTKIWTAFTFIESGAPFGETTVSTAAATAEGSSIYLKQGDVVEVEDLLYGLMLRSGNDAAQALAEHAGASMEGFVDMMNEKAQFYGLNDTVFTNPSGLHDELHLSTAHETALMLAYALENEHFKEIASTTEHTFKSREQTYQWYNKHRLLHSEPTAIAGKTGFTKAAGRTLATYFEKDDKRIVVVTLNDGDDWNSHLSLAEQTFSSYRAVTVAKKGRYAILPGIEGVLESPIRLLLKNGEKAEVSHIVRIPRGKSKTSIGHWAVLFNDEQLLTTEVLIEQ